MLFVVLGIIFFLYISVYNETRDFFEGFSQSILNFVYLALPITMKCMPLSYSSHVKGAMPRVSGARTQVDNRYAGCLFYV